MRTVTFSLGLIFLNILISCRPVSDSNSSSSTSGLLDRLELDLKEINQEQQLPGFTVSVFSKDRIFYQKGFGFANLETKTPYTPETVQMLASVSKTFIGAALMQLVEEGKVKLDESINSYLPFEVSNPHHPDIPITVKQLAMHTSGINDSAYYNKAYLFDSPLRKSDFSEEWHPLINSYNQNESMSMPAFLTQLFSPSGKWQGAVNFYPDPPGEVYHYSNLGAALLAFIIQLQSGQDYRTFTQSHIFQPLQMNTTFWRNPPKEQPQTQYYSSDLHAIPAYSIITYPDGGLYSTVQDLTLFLQEIMKAYSGESTLLSRASVQTMLQKQGNLPDGLCWDLSIPCCVGHAGNDFGTTTLMYFEPDSGIGRILFTNISIETEKLEETFYGIFNTLFEYDFNTLN